MNNRLPVNQDYVGKVLLSEPLAEEVRELIRQIRENPESEDVRKRAIELTHEAVETNLNYYILIPARQLRLHSVGIKLLNLVVVTVLKLIPSVGHRVIGRLTPEQMEHVADLVEEQLLGRDQK